MHFHKILHCLHSCLLACKSSSNAFAVFLGTARYSHLQYILMHVHQINKAVFKKKKKNCFIVLPEVTNSIGEPITPYCIKIGYHEALKRLTLPQMSSTVGFDAVILTRWIFGTLGCV